MKRRKGVTVFAALVSAFVVLAIAAFAVTMFVVTDLKSNFDFIACNKALINYFTDFSGSDLTPNGAVIGSLAIFVILGIIWAIVDGKRGRKIVIFFICLHLLSAYASMLYTAAVYPIANKLADLVKSNTLVFIPVGGLLFAGLAELFSVILFIVDMATGAVEKKEAPTFIKEPTEEVKEGVFEEVKDESEVEEEPVKEEPVKEEAPVAAAPAEEPVKEEPVKEETKEEAPAKEEAVKEEKKAPAKKAPAKKAPAKKAEAKKEEPKKAAPKAEAKKEEPKKAAPKAEATKEEPKKADARKTQTILLTNEDGNVYAKAYHVSRRPELNKWQVKATGSDKALKLFNTQKEAIEYAEQLAKNQNVSVRVHSKEGKIRKHTK